MAKKITKRWVLVNGFQKQVSANVPANTLSPIDLLSPVIIPSLTLILKLKAINNYISTSGVSSPTGWGFVSWFTPFSNYTQILDQMGGQGQPLNVVDEPELSPGQTLFIRAKNTDPANAYTAGMILRGELGYYLYE